MNIKIKYRVLVGSSNFPLMFLPGTRYVMVVQPFGSTTNSYCILFVVYVCNIVALDDGLFFEIIIIGAVIGGTLGAILVYAPEEQE